MTRASDPDMELKKCYQFGGYSGHRGASGTAGRTFRVYTGPVSSLGALRAHEKAMKDWIDVQEGTQSSAWSTLRNYGKSSDRIQPRGSVWGETRRNHKEQAARYVGRSYRLARADEAYEEQKALNDALAEGAGISTLKLAPILITPSPTGTASPSGTAPGGIKVLPGLGPFVSGVVPRTGSGGSGGNGQSDQYQELLDRIAELESTEDVGYMPSIDNLPSIDIAPPYVEEDGIPAWMWAAGGAAALLAVHMMTRKKD